MMAQYEHCISRTVGKTDEYVELCDGRGTTTMPIAEFISYAAHISAVAAGAQESMSEEYLAREADFQSQRNPSNIAERANAILSAIGLGGKKQGTFRLLGKESK